MKTLTIISLFVLASTPAFARNLDLAYARSGTHAGGRADLLISSTGGPVAPHRPLRIDPAYARSGSHAGGPAHLLISSTGGAGPRPAPPPPHPAHALSRSHARGPAQIPKK